MADELFTGSSTEIIPFSQDEIEGEVKKILLDKGLVDIIYPGSNISQISDVMTYLVHVLNTNTAINLQEVLLPLATKRMNVLWGARQLGYEPKQRVSFVYILNLIAKKNPNFGQNPGEPGYDTVYQIQLPKYTKFSSGGHDYWYFGERTNIEVSNEMIDNDDPKTKINITVKEGNLIRFQENSLLRFRSFNIVNDEGEIEVKQNYIVPFDNVEETGLEVFLTYTDENNVDHIREKWYQSAYFLVDTSYEEDKNKYARMQNIFANMPEIFFEVGGIGPKIRLNTLIEINVLQSNGKNGQASESFSITDPEMSSTWAINGFYESQHGTEVESSRGIRENAPVFHNSANRLVTAYDYVAMTRRHNKVDRVVCWGAEDETGRGEGYVYLAMTPERTIQEYLSVTDTETPGYDDDNPRNDNEYDKGNNYFVLQKTPRHPYNEYNGDFYMGSDDWNGSPVNIYPEKTETVIGNYWTIRFDDTNNDGTMDIFGGDLDGVTVALGDILVLEDDGSGGKIFATYVPDESMYPTDSIKGSTVHNWYLDEYLDIIIRKNLLDNNQIPTTVFTYLEPFQIMSLRSYYRQPVYCDFDIKINLIQNNISVSQREINYEVFNIVKNHFDTSIEDFNTQFILSTLVAKITELSQHIDGLNITFSNKLILHPVMYDAKLKEFDVNQKTIMIKLAFPFERIYDLSTFDLIPTFLPQIKKYGDGPDIFVDFDAFWTGDGTEAPTVGSKVIAAPIHLGTDNTGDIVGYYFIRNDYQMDIEIELYFSDDGTIKTNPSPDISDYIDFVTPGKQLQANIKESDFFIDSDYGYLELIYPGLESTDWQNITTGQNLPFTGYTIPRLNSVKFLRKA